VNISSSPTLSVWIVDDDDSIRWVLEKAMQRAGMLAQGFSDPLTALEALASARPDVLITDIRMPGMDGLEFSRLIGAMNIDLPIIVVTAHTDLDSAVAAYQSGAFEYLPKPFDVDEAVSLVHRAAEASRARKASSAPPASGTGMSGMVGQAPAMQEVFRTIGRLSRASMTVLITGESGTGKELVARALHEHSPRVNGPFVALNTTAIAAELLESELFGHERGAFTGADRQRIGRFEQADGGTLFLDEIGDMSPDLQTRLLRVLAESEFYRVGGQKPIHVDVRIIAATNQNMETAVEDGRFRADLYHRLNVMRINTPPLRSRREDIPMLLQHYLAKSSQELGVSEKSLTDDALKLLVDFDWPGNVRQLLNATRRLSITAPGNEIRAADIPAALGGAPEPAAGAQWMDALQLWADKRLRDDAEQPLLDSAIPDFERVLISAALQAAGGRKQDAAKLLGWGRNTLTRKIKELKLD
jgi:two-component system nitrogen regulation response regulator GlnG